MKKYLLMIAVAISALMSSCSNDDIPVTKAVTFKLELESVVSPFTAYAEHSAGELVNLDGAQLRVQLFAYDAAGNLVDSDKQFFDEYSNVMTSGLALGEGSYTIVAISDVLFEDGTEIWGFSDVNKLSTLTMTDQGYIGGEYKIIGMASQKVTISSFNREFNMSLKPIGALAVIYVLNADYYSNVTQYSLSTNKTCNKLTLNNSAQPQYSSNSNSDYNWDLYRWNVNGANGYYGYAFMFPQREVKFKFFAELTDESWIGLGSGTYGQFDIVAGEQYKFQIDMELGETGETKWYRYVPNGRSTEEKPDNVINTTSLRVIDHLNIK